MIGARQYCMEWPLKRGALASAAPVPLVVLESCLPNQDSTSPERKRQWPGFSGACTWQADFVWMNLVSLY